MCTSSAPTPDQYVVPVTCRLYDPRYVPILREVAIVLARTLRPFYSILVGWVGVHVGSPDNRFPRHDRRRSRSDIFSIASSWIRLD